jgi:hypothetical protein
MMVLQSSNFIVDDITRSRVSECAKISPLDERRLYNTSILGGMGNTNFAHPSQPRQTNMSFKNVQTAHCHIPRWRMTKISLPIALMSAYLVPPLPVEVPHDSQLEPLKT